MKSAQWKDISSQCGRQIVLTWGGSERVAKDPSQPVSSDRNHTQRCNRALTSAMITINSASELAFSWREKNTGTSTNTVCKSALTNMDFFEWHAHVMLHTFDTHLCINGDTYTKFERVQSFKTFHRAGNMYCMYIQACHGQAVLYCVTYI